MLGIILLFSLYINGFYIQKFFLGHKNQDLYFVSSFISGTTITLLVLMISLLTTSSLYAGSIISIVLACLLIIRNSKKILKVRWFKAEYLVILILFLLSFLLFEKSFSYKNESHTFLIQTNLYQDFGAHIPFARYFTSTLAFPEVPFYAGAGLRYHFLFDFLSGSLERLGLRLDLAFNILSALSLTTLLMVIYKLSVYLFKKSEVGVFACIFFVFNGDLSFITTLKNAHYSLVALYHNNLYSTDNFFNLPKLLNFLNLNTLLNQRHLILALLILFYVILMTIRLNSKSNWKLKIFLGCIFATLPFVNSLTWFALFILLISLFFFFSQQRQNIRDIIIVGLIVSFPQLLLIKISTVFSPFINPGFLMVGNLSFFTFISMWVWYLGAGIILIPLGLLYSNSLSRKVFISFFILFLIGNIIQFTPEMFDNHKLFNISIILFNMFSALGLYMLLKRNIFLKTIGTLLFILMVISGTCNIFVIKNDIYAKVSDSSNSKLAIWAETHVDKNDIFLTNGEIYDPISVAGYRTFLGRAHYLYTYGGDPSVRIIQQKEIFSGQNLKNVKSILKSNNIHYIILYNSTKVTNSIKPQNNIIQKNFKKVYEDDLGVIYKT